jgi:hypothetical protein
MISFCVCRRDILSRLERALAYDLNPVSVWIQCEGNVPGSTIVQLLLKLVACVFYSLARSLDIVNADAGVTEALVGVTVSSGDCIVRVRLCAVVVCKLDEAFAVAAVIALRVSFRRVVTQEVEVKFSFRLLKFLDYRHSKKLVEFDKRKVSQQTLTTGNDLSTNLISGDL